MAQVPARVSQEIVRAARRQRAARLYNARKERWRFRARRLRRAFLAMAGVFIAAIVAGLVLGGLSDTAWLLSMLLGGIVFMVLCVYPGTPRPHAGDLAGGQPARKLAGSTEIWLEGKRRALPNAALDAVDMIGVRLEQIAPQLAMIDEGGPAAREARKLLSEHLPELVNSYTRIPPPLRGEPGAGGASPSEQLVHGLAVIADELDAMSHDLSRNDIDALATRGRFLEIKYVDPRENGAG